MRSIKVLVVACCFGGIVSICAAPAAQASPRPFEHREIAQDTDPADAPGREYVVAAAGGDVQESNHGTLSPAARHLSLDDVVIDSSEVRGVCEAIEGEHPVSIQPAVQYRMSGEKGADIVYGDPVNKRFQSFSCAGTDATVYYYEHASKDELKRHLAGIKTVLLGVSEQPSALHPELVLDIDNVLIVVSSHSPYLLAAVLSHRASFPDLEDNVIDERLRRLSCGSGNALSEEICTALRDFKKGSVPSLPRREDLLLIGQSWEVSGDGRSSEANFEVVYLGQIPSGETVAGFGPVTPDTEQERSQTLAQIEAQRDGKVADGAQPLMAFAREAFGGTKARAQQTGHRSLAFLGMGTRIYLRRFADRLLLTTDAMHPHTGDPFVVAVFNVPTG